jgi:cation transport ATPase
MTSSGLSEYSEDVGRQHHYSLGIEKVLAPATGRPGPSAKPKERTAQLRKTGFRSIMITGDNPLTAAPIASEAGVTTSWHSHA